MKKKAYENSKIKYQLLDKKRKGVKKVIWKLDQSKRMFIENELHFAVETYLYQIKTRQFHNISRLDSILKEIHFSSKRGKSTVVFRLNSNQKKILDEFGINYRPYKYIIWLNN